MYKKAPSSRTKTPVETTKQFRQLIANSLSKMKDAHTAQIAFEELRELMRIHVNSTERMNALLSIFAEQNEHMGLIQRKEGMKLFGVMGEVFESSLFPFIPKVINICQKRVEDPQLHTSVSDSLGIMIHHVFKQAEASEKVKQLSSIVGQLLDIMRQGSKNVQIGSGMCLTRVIQNSPIETLTAVLEPLTCSLLELTQNSSLKCNTQVLETLISLVLAVEYEFEPYAHSFVPVLVECMQNLKEWTTRKMAIDVVYTFAAFLPGAIAGDVESIVAVLRERKADKVKHVREAAHEALAKINENRSADSGANAISVEESKQSIEGKSIFQGPANPNFFKAAPKSNEFGLTVDGIEIMTTSPKRAGKENLPEAKDSVEKPNLDTIEEAATYDEARESAPKPPEHRKEQKAEMKKLVPEELEDVQMYDENSRDVRSSDKAFREETQEYLGDHSEVYGDDARYRYDDKVFSPNKEDYPSEEAPPDNPELQENEKEIEEYKYVPNERPKSGRQRRREAAVDSSMDSNYQHELNKFAKVPLALDRSNNSA
eukprot:TRINITY_DN12547_c0_g1_i2.p1 TRINITY_DN12547_c0_g1~~TRINITY_DN12547_c0_g1_i2.p1  ORF type:complete len:542 (-),score=180.89 TRINITY_DN12547_c0_g1_i2:653-2278(-)